MIPDDKTVAEGREHSPQEYAPEVPEYVTGQRAPRRRLAGRMTRTFVLMAGVLLLGMGLVLTWVSYDAQLEQVRVRQH
jgi:uncharacterized membrane protein